VEAVLVVDQAVEEDRYHRHPDQNGGGRKQITFPGASIPSIFPGIGDRLIGISLSLFDIIEWIINHYSARIIQGRFLQETYLGIEDRQCGLLLR
jgi:hypothetical protein